MTRRSRAPARGRHQPVAVVVADLAERRRIEIDAGVAALRRASALRR